MVPLLHFPRGLLHKFSFFLWKLWVHARRIPADFRSKILAPPGFHAEAYNWTWRKQRFRNWLVHDQRLNLLKLSGPILSSSTQSDWGKPSMGAYKAERGGGKYTQFGGFKINGLRILGFQKATCALAIYAYRFDSFFLGLFFGSPDSCLLSSLD